MGKGQIRVRKAIEIVEAWTEENKMKINKKKSGVIFFKKKKRKKMQEEETEINNIPIVTEYKYLGV